jgi:hypothetical protein
MIMHLVLSASLCVVAAVTPPAVVPGGPDHSGPAIQDRRGSIHQTLPAEIDTEARYLFYLHGRIIEDEGVRPTHPQFGVYEYELILDELAASGLVVISEIRPPGADGMEHARKTAQQVRELLDAGVPPDHITVMGFSKGGGIAILTSWELQQPEVRFVWLAACGDWAFRMSALVPAGRILSIYEASDQLGVSCEPLFDRSDLIQAEEVRIETGERHGAFYRPIPEWIEPAVAWLRRDLEPLPDSVPERLPDWVAALGYGDEDLIPIHTGRFGYPYVLVTVNGVPFDLPFDTGNMVGISLRPEGIERLGLPLAESWDRLSSDGRVVGTYSSYSGATVEVWGEVWRDELVFEFDDPDLPGLLGPQHLLGKRYTLDYGAGLMAISEHPLTTDEKAGLESVPLVDSQANPGLVLFHGQVHGRRVLIQADTGKSRCTIDPQLAGELRLQENEHGFRIEELHVGSHTFEVRSAKAVNLRPIDDSLEDPILLGIGSDVLSRIPITVDYIGGRLLLPVAAGSGQGASLAAPIH